MFSPPLDLHSCPMCVYINSTRGPFSDTDAFSNCSQKKRGKQIFKGIFLHISSHSRRVVSIQMHGIWNNDIAEVWLITHLAIRPCCWVVQERIDPRALCFILPIMKFSSLSLHTNACLIFFPNDWEVIIHLLFITTFPIQLSGGNTQCMPCLHCRDSHSS